MPSPFSRLESVACRALAAVFDETIDFMPMVQPENGRPVVDPARPARVDIRVSLSRPVERAESRIDLPRTEDQPRAKRFGHSATAYLTLAQLGYRPQQGDRLIAKEIEGQPKYGISRVEPDGADRFICPLILLGGTP